MKHRVVLGTAVAAVAAVVAYQLAPIGDGDDELRLAQAVQPGATRHLALNTSVEDYPALIELGYDLFDVGSSAEAIAAVPEGGAALVWVGEFSCQGGFTLTDEQFQALVTEHAADAKVYGWYLADEPDVAGCPTVVEAITARAQFIETAAPEQVAFVAASSSGDLAPLAPATSGVDLIGLDPFPCQGAAAGAPTTTTTTTAADEEPTEGEEVAEGEEPTEGEETAEGQDPAEGEGEEPTEGEEVAEGEEPTEGEEPAEGEEQAEGEGEEEAEEPAEEPAEEEPAAAGTCDVTGIATAVEAATAAGIPAEAIVPTIQTFGSECATNGDWTLPTEEGLRSILTAWSGQVPTPTVEVTYAWASLPGWTCPTLADANGTGGLPDLQSVMKEHNTGAATPPADSSSSSSSSTTPPEDGDDSSSSSSSSTTAPAAADPGIGTGAGTGTGPTAAEALGYTTPVFSDEFDTYSETDWMVYGGPSEHTPGEFTPTGGGERKREQITTAGSVMTVTGLPNGDTAGMNTEHTQTYGLWEARVKLPADAVDYHSVMILMIGACEIDWMEDMDAAGREVDGFLHTPGGEGHGHVTMEDNDWHNWAIEWTAEHMRLYLDGEMWHESTMGGDIDCPVEAGEMTIQLDWFPSDEGETGTAELQVDWVNIYEQQ
jgi:glycosyl hydrolase family 16